MKSPVGTTDDFLELFAYAAGTWKTPTHFHRWAGISLIAACMEDRVSLPIFDHAPLFPNLWVFLIGGSGVGKDHAIGHALSYLKLNPDDEDADQILVHDGKATISGLYDRMISFQKSTGRETAPMWLISSDVGEQLPLGPEAKDFTSRSLGLYGGRDRNLGDATRTSGHDKIVKRPLLNWIAGCTPRWFPNAIDPEVFHSGYAGRTFFVEGEPDARYEHMLKPLMPPDAEKVRAILRKRIELYLRVEGKFVLTKRARTVLDDWLLHRTQEQKGQLSDLEREVRGRQPTAVLKLAMTLAMAEWVAREPLKIKWRHAAQAISVVESMVSGLRLVGSFVYRNEETTAVETVRELVKQYRTIPRTNLLKLACARGVKNSKHLDIIVDTLIQTGEIQRHSEKRKIAKAANPDVTRPAPGPPKLLYKWSGNKTTQNLIAMRKQAHQEEVEDGNEQIRQEGLANVTEGSVSGDGEGSTE